MATERFFQSDVKVSGQIYEYSVPLRQTYALSGTGGGGGSTTLSGLTDVLYSHALTSGEVLSYNGTEWTNATVSGGGGGGGSITGIGSIGYVAMWDGATNLTSGALTWTTLGDLQSNQGINEFAYLSIPPDNYAGKFTFYGIDGGSHAGQGMNFDFIAGYGYADNALGDVEFGAQGGYFSMYAGDSTGSNDGGDVILGGGAHNTISGQWSNRGGNVVLIPGADWVPGISGAKHGRVRIQDPITTYGAEFDVSRLETGISIYFFPDIPYNTPEDTAGSGTIALYSQFTGTVAGLTQTMTFVSGILISVA